MSVSMKAMLEAGVHFGHQTKRWNPKMRPYIYGARNGIYIVDLQQTQTLFSDAFNFVKKTTARGKSVLFVGTKRQAREVLEEEAARSNQYFVTNRWLGGMLTNFKTVKFSIDRYKFLSKIQDDGTINQRPKKEVLKLNREWKKLDANLRGIADMPDEIGAVFVIDPGREHIAVKEAIKKRIPVIAVTDTNCDPDVVDYVIPGNDDAIRAIRLFASRIADAAIEGRQNMKSKAVAGSGASYVEGSEKPVVDKASDAKAPVPVVEVTKGKPLLSAVAASESKEAKAEEVKAAAATEAPAKTEDKPAKAEEKSK
jgi:small subunit ribosomal protein S2